MTTTSAMNISLMIYFILVSLIGTFGNGIILLAYGNRWNSSKSTSVVFILVLACVDLWTCLIVVPTIAIMEYREFEVPTILCRFYSFSKILIIISSLIMSFIALDRFLNIALPHYRLLNPRRVKFLLTLFILTGIGLGILTALAFSSMPNRDVYLANYTLIQSNDSSFIKYLSNEISLTDKIKNDSIEELSRSVAEQHPLPIGANITNLILTYRTSHVWCFADTKIISENLREILKHISNKFFFISIGIVTIFYTITFLLALHRQNPRIRALKKSLNVINKFDAYPSQYQSSLSANSNQPTSHLNQKVKQRKDSTNSNSPIYTFEKTNTFKIEPQNPATNDNQQYEMASFVSNDDLEESNALDTPKQDYPINISEATSDEKFLNAKQVSFQVENANDQQQLESLTNSFSSDLDRRNSKYYKFPCPCSRTRQFLIKFHFAQPTLDIHQWLCFCCMKKSSKSTTKKRESSLLNPVEDETSTILPSASISTVHHQHHHSTTGETLKRQLHRHRLKQLRMALTFLIITISFVLFYLPSILNAERIIKSPLLVYYLFLCTHALNPIIYCFMNVSLRAYILTMFRCRKRRQRGQSLTVGTMANA